MPGVIAGAFFCVLLANLVASPGMRGRSCASRSARQRRAHRFYPNLRYTMVVNPRAVIMTEATTSAELWP
jgi:hypothetical protein